MSYTLIDNDTGKDIIETITNQKEEIKTLKNNWNELEDWLETTISIHKQKGSEMLVTICSDILNKIKELKEKNKFNIINKPTFTTSSTSGNRRLPPKQTKGSDEE